MAERRREIVEKAKRELLARLEGGKPYPPPLDMRYLREYLHDENIARAVEEGVNTPHPTSPDEAKTYVMQRKRGILREIANRFGEGSLSLVKDYVMTAAISNAKAARDVLKQENPHARSIEAWYAGLSIGLPAVYAALRYLYAKTAEEGFNPESPYARLLKPSQENVAALAAYAAHYFAPVVADVKAGIIRERRKGIENIDLWSEKPHTTLVARAAMYAWGARYRIGVTKTGEREVRKVPAKA